MATWSLPPMALDRPWVLPLALAAAVGWLVGWRAMEQHRRARLRRFALPVAWDRLGVAVSAARGTAWRVAAVLLLGGVALAGPRWGLARTASSSVGIDMAIALDASQSMLAHDERPSSLERMKQEVRRLRAMAPSDRVALLAFAGRSYILTPLTSDDGALELFLDNLDPSLVGEGGSSLARAMAQGAEVLMASDGAADRALVVLTDGETFDPPAEVERAARALGAQGIHLVTVGFGTPAGSTIPVEEEGRVAAKRDVAGQVVITRYDPGPLAAAARAAGGEFIPAEAGDKAARVRRAVRDLRTARRATAVREDLVLRVGWLLVPAVLLLLWDTARGARPGGSTRGRRVEGGPIPPGGRAATALLAVLTVASPGCSRGADPAALFQAGDVQRALADYRAQVAAGDSTPRTRFNLGTALLANDSLAEASPLLEGARRETEGEVRQRARFNAAVAALRQARAPGAREADRWRAEAREALRALLRERPGDLEAKWNYELALRAPPGGGGGGGGAGGGEGAGGPPEAEDASPPPSGSLDARQAEALLNSAARDERDVQGRRKPAGRTPPRGKDW
jgi:Ca-activated chloride channel family protein